MSQVHGKCDPKFEGVRIKFKELLDTGVELGASLAVKIDGEDVINLWGGFADAGRSRPWTEDTIVNVFSTTKTVCALAALMLINDGQLSPNDKVSKHWPEFAVNGKEDIEVRHLLSHTSGLAVFDEPIKAEDLYDVKLSTSRLEKQAPLWPPGTASGYHAWTYGYLIGELVHRKTGLGLKEFVAQKISGPLGADFQIGAKEEDWPRIAELIPPPYLIPLEQGPMPPPDSIAAKALAAMPDVTIAHTPAWRKTEIGSANGHGNGQSLAQIWSNAINIGDDSKRLLSKKTIDLIFQEQSYGSDLAFQIPVRFGIGLGLRGKGDVIVDSWLPEGRVCFWGGLGGSIVINDLDRGFTLGYAMNKMEPGTVGNSAVKAYVAEIYKALGVAMPVP